MSPEEVTAFWLQDIGPKQWYNPPDGLDAEIRARFETACLAARGRRLGPWAGTPTGALALLLLLDQFPRNIWRGEAGAFASDYEGLRQAKSAIARGMDRLIPEPERQFFYLPLMHSEVLADQERCIRLIMLRLPEHGDKNLTHGLKHREVIRRFGRFPSRNAALGRQDTAAELKYRADGGYMA